MGTRPQVSLIILALGVSLALAPLHVAAQTTEELIANLHSPLVKSRREAAEKLGHRRERIAVQPLIEALRHDDDAQVRRLAARSLGLIKDEAAIPALIAALDDEEGSVRQAAIVGLVMYYIERNIDFITARRQGLQWLNPFLSTYEATIVEPYTRVHPGIIDALVNVALRDRDRQVKTSAIRALGVLRATSAIPRLGNLMFANSFLRVEILRTFIKLEDPAAASFIIPFLDDDDADVRYQALMAIGILRSEAAVAKLMDVYRSSPDLKTRKLALQALALIGDPAAVDIFVANLSSAVVDHRRYAYEGLARVGDPQFVERISRSRLRERNDGVKLAQAFALYKLGRREYIEAIVLDLDTGRRQQAYEYLLEVDPRDLYPYLRQSSLPGLKWIVEALGRVGPREAIDRLQPLLRAQDAELVRATTLAIERLKRRTGQQKRPKRIGRQPGR